MMELHEAGTGELATLTDWIADAQECLSWGGPRVRFPLEPEALAEQLVVAPGNSYWLYDAGRRIGFGQLLERGPGRLHLARILIDPARRGQGGGRALVAGLVEQARQRKAESATLNVYRWNPAARTLYQSLGFVATSPPAAEEVRGDDVIFMSMTLSASR
ncbi:GNAT family N-acetyltransferase [Crenobacter oryzisoli]|nr:GNAT family N-acetyltransferase [Crenobacter sp. SG2303]